MITDATETHTNQHVNRQHVTHYLGNNINNTRVIENVNYGLMKDNCMPNPTAHSSFLYKVQTSVDVLPLAAHVGSRGCNFTPIFGFAPLVWHATKTVTMNNINNADNF